jgi:ABC-2 type transport system permease protein
MYMVAELLLSGRLVPLGLMPGWVQAASWAMPFRWTFGYPITALVGPISNRELLLGLLAQAGWITVGGLLVKVVWPRGIKRFSAVGG